MTDLSRLTEDLLAAATRAGAEAADALALDGASVSVIGDVGDVVKLPKRHGHREDAVSKVMPYEYVEGRFIDVAICR